MVGKGTNIHVRGNWEEEAAREQVSETEDQGGEVV